MIIKSARYIILVATLLAMIALGTPWWSAVIWISALAGLTYLENKYT